MKKKTLYIPVVNINNIKIGKFLIQVELIEKIVLPVLEDSLFSTCYPLVCFGLGFQFIDIGGLKLPSHADTAVLVHSCISC